MDGWMGTSVKIKPDQMQIMNPIMILLFLPLFQYGIYPLIEKCGFQMTSLRRMSGGQIITAVAFMVAGFLQLSIEKGLTPIPDYETQNSLMVVNGIHNAKLEIESQYWDGIEVEDVQNNQTHFTVQGQVK